MLIGIDVGTTHCKAGLFTHDGTNFSMASRPNIAHRGGDGGFYFDPTEVYQAACSAIAEVTHEIDPHSIVGIGIASMAETGLLVDRESGSPRCPFIPWYDTTASSVISKISRSVEPLKQFSKTGIRPSFKTSLAKLLSLKVQDEAIWDGAMWLHIADYMVFRLTGSIGTDYTLAGRTYVYRIDQKVWDKEILDLHDMDSSLFPPVFRSGSVIGYLHEEGARDTGLVPGLPVSICGHDHVCAAFGVRMAIKDLASDFIVDSIGTAEALMGSIQARQLQEEEFNSGLAFGCDVKPGHLYWMGGLSASGGSIEWVRRIMGEPPLSYQEIEKLMDKAGRLPTGILYFPYLSGSGSPHSDANVRAAFIGLKNVHSQADLVKAVLEGTAFEMEFIRRRAERCLGVNVSKIVVVGGGIRNLHWLQIKADVFGCPLEIPKINEATLLGAALLAGIGSEFYRDEVEVTKSITSIDVYSINPDINGHEAYLDLYEKGFLTFQKPLRGFSS